MKSPKKIVCAILCLTLLINSVSAFETDQFNLPPQPLADIGDEVSEYVGENLQKAIEKINAEIVLRQNCLASNSAKQNKIKCGAPHESKIRLEYLRSEDAVAREVFGLLGDGFIPYTKSGTWMEKHEFRAKFARYKTDFSDSIFAVAPINYLTVSSTVKIYDAEFGTDKIAHFFQQGYSYFRIYKKAVNAGTTPEKAVQKAVNWGKLTERTYYGTLVSGVYSNADLSANFAGMKFYQNLTQPIKIGDQLKSAIFRLENGVWIFNESVASPNNFFKPFVSEHFNEALNSSIYSNLFGLRAYVRRTVRKRGCRQWLQKYPNLSPIDLDKTSQALKLWHGEDYGFTDSRHFVTISRVCFDHKNARIEASE